MRKANIKIKTKRKHFIKQNLTSKQLSMIDYANIISNIDFKYYNLMGGYCMFNKKFNNKISNNYIKMLLSKLGKDDDIEQLIEQCNGYVHLNYTYFNTIEEGENFIAILSLMI